MGFTICSKGSIRLNPTAAMIVYAINLERKLLYTQDLLTVTFSGNVAHN
jgi:hypothetical protein